MYIADDTINSFMARGNSRPSGYAEYDALHGYVERTYVTEWTDIHGTRWRKTCQIINLGRADRVTPDPDAQLALETWEHESKGPRNTALAYETHRKIAAARRLVMQKRIVAFLMVNGPSVAHCIAEGIGIKYTSLKSHLNQHAVRVARGEEERVYCEVGNVVKATIWGVVGIHFPEKRAT